MKSGWIREEIAFFFQTVNRNYSVTADDPVRLRSPQRSNASSRLHQHRSG